MYTIKIEAQSVAELRAKLEDFAKIITVDMQTSPQQVAPTPAKKATKKVKEEVATPIQPQPVPTQPQGAIPVQPQPVPIAPQGVIPQSIPVGVAPQGAIPVTPQQQGLPIAPQGAIPVTPQGVISQGVPVQPQAVPVGNVAYTKEDLAKAGSVLADRGLMAPVVEALKRYGVQSISDLAPEYYGNFAADLRSLGAQI